MLGKIEGGRRRDDRGWDGWMSSPTQWTWVWVNSGSWWWRGRPGMLFMGSQRVRHDWATELNWTEKTYILNVTAFFFFFKSKSLGWSFFLRIIRKKWVFVCNLWNIHVHSWCILYICSFCYPFISYIIICLNMFYYLFLLNLESRIPALFQFF